MDTALTETKPRTSHYPAAETTDVPGTFEGVKELLLDSKSEFLVSLDGKEEKTTHLEVRHTKPLTVYGVKGMEKAVYLQTGLDVETDHIVEVNLIPRAGKFAVTSIETDPTQERLAKTEKTGFTKYKCPREVIVGSRLYNDLDIVEVSGLRDGKTRLIMG